MGYQDTSHSIVPTDLNILGSGLVFREVRRVWMSAARAMMRLDLLKILQSEGLGLQTVENFVQSEAWSRHSQKFRNKPFRNVSQIDNIMRLKIRDTYLKIFLGKMLSNY